MVTLSPNKTARPLKKGDEFVIAETSSFLNDKNSIDKGIKVLTEWGLVFRERKLSPKPWGYLAGNDKYRFEQVHPSPTASLIACVRGGWGAARLLEQDQPWTNGWVLGYSDICSLLLSRLSRNFDGCIHGPLISSIGEEPDWSKDRLRSILFGETIPDLKGESWQGGIAKGPIVAMNLTIGTSLIGTAHMPDLKGSILIFEDINEQAYRIDRMLTQWRLTGLLNNIEGIGFGNFVECNSDKNDYFKIEEIIKERCIDLKIPIIGSLAIGHANGNAALPLGKIACLNGNKGTISFNYET